MGAQEERGPGSNMQSARPATLHDVARRAEVSAQTVSRFVKGYERIQPATRARIEAAITELRYRPNIAARQLRTQRSTRIGALVHDLFEHGPGSFMRGATIGARRAGYSLDIVGVDRDDERSINDAVLAFEEERVAGILTITGTDTVRRVLDSRPLGVPVLIDPAEAAGTGPSVNHSGGELAANHLIQLGHQRLGLIAGPESWLPARMRRERFISVATDLGGSVTLIGQGDWSADSGAELADRFVDTTGITAVFAANDNMAIGFIHRLAQHGISTPAGVSVVGFDDIPQSPYMTPPLTTIQPAYEEQGRGAIEALLAEINGRAPHPIVHPQATLVVRGTTAPPPQDRRTYCGQGDSATRPPRTA